MCCNLRMVMDNGDVTVGAMIDYCVENEQGLYVADEWYTYEEIRPILEVAGVV